MRKVFLAFATACALISCNEKQETKSEEPMVKTATAPAPAEFADQKYVQMGQSAMREFEAGNIDKWVEQFADNAVFLWSAGDSLAGKAAIADYWKKRRADVIDKIQFTNDIWTPLKVNQSQKGPDLPGVWLLNWYQVNVTYKNGKSLAFWVHNDYHFDANDKIDRAVQYIDRAPINAALRK